MNVRNFSRDDLQRLDAVLRADPVVHDCFVLAREHARRGKELIAYIVPTESFRVTSLHDRLRAALPVPLLPAGYVPLSSLPLTEQGFVDEQVLEQFEVIDDTLIQRWEERLRDLPGIEEMAVVVQEREKGFPQLHLSELLPEGAVPGVGLYPMFEPSGLQDIQREDSEPKALAFSDGGKLMIDQDAPRTLGEAFVRTAAMDGDKGIRYMQQDHSGTFQSYASLLKEAKCVLTGLRRLGFKPRDRVILQIENLQDYFPVLWACVLAGIAPVTVAVPARYDEKSSLVTKILHAWTILDHPRILASDQLCAPLASLEATLAMRDLAVISIDALRRCPPAESVHQSQPDDIAFFQLTSGSTGMPKCIQETHAGIIAHIHASQKANSYQPTDVSLNWLPMDHVVPILTYHFKDSYLGCQQIQLATGGVLANPLLWLDNIERYGVTHTWSPNFGYKLINDSLIKVDTRSWDLSSIKFFMNAGEQVTLPVVREFLRLTEPFGVPSDAIQPAFGMAEVCTCMTYQNHFSLDAGARRIGTSAFVDLGPPVPGVQIRITDNENHLLPEDVVGRLQIKGEVVTPGYLNNPAANQEAFVGEGWFNTGDLGFIHEGRLTITGREKEMIIIRGVNYYCHEIEELVNSVPGVAPTFVGACSLEDRESGTEELAVFFTPLRESMDETVDIIKTIRATIASNLSISAAYVIPVDKPEFPKTTSGKIQRGRLKELLKAGHFRATLQAIDVQLENTHTIPDWFFRTIWRQRQALPLAPEIPEGPYLVFVDPRGFGKLLLSELERNRRPYVQIEAGFEFAKLGPNHYRINAGEPADYRRLLAYVVHDHGRLPHVLHVWTFDELGSEPSSLKDLEQDQGRGATSVVFLVQALVQNQTGNERVCLFVISSYAQAACAADQLAYARAAVLGICSTLPQEMPWIRCRHIDLPERFDQNSAALIIQELRSIRDDRQVAYRDGNRLVTRLEKAELLQEPQRELPFRHGGMYLLSGGLGGIGAILAKHLLQRYEARVLIIGRTALPPKSEWSIHLDQGSAVAGRIKTYSGLRHLAGEVIYEIVDVRDENRLQQVVEQAEARWQRTLDGVVHCAGVFEERPLCEENDRSMAATLRPKASGSWALHQLAKSRPNVLVIHFSSVVNGFFGGAMAGVYAAANSFVEALSHHQRSIGLRSYCFSWSMWNEVGLSCGYRMKELFRAHGFHLLSAEQGVYSLLAGLCRAPGSLIVGLEAGNRRIQQHIETDAVPAHKLVAYYTGTASFSLQQCQDSVVLDRFGVSTDCEAKRLTAMPRGTRGEIDRERLRDADHGRMQSQSAPPQTPLQKRVAEVWKEIMGVSHVGLSDTFLELGGDSLRGTQIVSRLNEMFPVHLSVRSFLAECPTIAALADVLEEKLIEKLDQLPESEAQRLLQNR
jgi:acyl-CoA synthetase (AMP-forming)/AMP-acid ligase II/NAD(P)-dependent dehydrogenase (short-subunit alcohol dehydrogenase family)/acyl carrier protein